MQEASEKPPCSGEGSKGLRNVDMQCPMFRKDVPEQVLGVDRGRVEKPIYCTPWSVLPIIFIVFSCFDASISLGPAHKIPTLSQGSRI